MFFNLFPEMTAVVAFQSHQAAGVCQPLRKKAGKGNPGEPDPEAHNNKGNTGQRKGEMGKTHFALKQGLQHALFREAKNELAEQAAEEKGKDGGHRGKFGNIEQFCPDLTAEICHGLTGQLQLVDLAVNVLEDVENAKFRGGEYFIFQLVTFLAPWRNVKAGAW